MVVGIPTVDGIIITIIEDKEMENFVSIDLETRNLSEEGLILEGSFLKSHPSTKDELKKVQQIAEKKAALAGKGALKDSAQIGCISIYSPSILGPSPVVLHTFPQLTEETYSGVVCSGHKTEQGMLEEFKQFLDENINPETVVVGANIKGFDLPKLRLRAAISRVPIPLALRLGSPNPIYDVTYNFGRYYQIGDAKFVSLDEVIRRLGIEVHGKLVSGAEIPDMIDRNEFEDVIQYCANDAVLTAAAYSLMNL